jgi:hypothetical protein
MMARSRFSADDGLHGEVEPVEERQRRQHDQLAREIEVDGLVEIEPTP